MSGRLIVNVNKIRENILNIKARINSSLFCAVVKANCYGFGIDLCKHIEDIVDYFAVATLAEARELAKIINKRILVLTPPSICEIKGYKDIPVNIEFAVDSKQTLEWLVSRKHEYRIHIAVNTGMNRHGINYTDYIEMLDVVKGCKGISLVGVFSHLYSVIKEDINKQYNRFLPFIDAAKKMNKDIICHLSNSSGLIHCLDMVRVGIGMYNVEDTDCFRLESRILNIRTIDKGEVIGYNAHFVAKSKMRVAVVPVGYADGIMRAMGGGNVIINGKLCTIVGDICMDCFMVDVSNCGAAKVGDRVVIIGSTNKQSINICQIATKCDTICYELLSRIGSRIQRVYKI